MFRPPSNDTPPRSGGLFGHHSEDKGPLSYGLKQQQADLFGDSGKIDVISLNLSVSSELFTPSSLVIS